MFFKMRCWSFVLLSYFFCSVVGLVVYRNHNFVSVRQNQSVDLVCSVDSNVQISFCLFRSPQNQNYLVSDGISYLNGKVATKSGLRQNECGITLINVLGTFNGIWECSVGAMGANGDTDVASALINITVALAPSAVFLRSEDDTPLESQWIITKRNQTSGTSKPYFVDCVAEHSRPAPIDFQWTIGGQTVQADTHRLVENSDEDNNAGLVTTVERFSYFPSPVHNNLLLECRIQHVGYSPRQLEEKANLASVKLSLLFKPLIQSHELTFYDLIEAASDVIRMNFACNPEPHTIYWEMFGLNESIALGSTSSDNNFRSSALQGGDTRDQYRVELDVKKLDKKMADGINKLVVINDVGSTEYIFRLVFDSAPPTEPLGVGPIVVIVVAVLVVLVLVALGVFSRAKGAKQCCSVDDDKRADETLTEKQNGQAEDVEKAVLGKGVGDVEAVTDVKKTAE